MKGITKMKKWFVSFYTQSGGVGNAIFYFERFNLNKVIEQLEKEVGKHTVIFFVEMET